MTRLLISTLYHIISLLLQKVNINYADLHNIYMQICIMFSYFLNSLIIRARFLFVRTVLLYQMCFLFI